MVSSFRKTAPRPRRTQNDLLKLSRGSQKPPRGSQYALTVQCNKIQNIRRISMQRSAPTSQDAPRAFQEASEEGPNTPKPLIFICFFDVFCVLAFSASGRSKTAQEAPKTAPRRPTKLPRRPRNGPRGPPRRPKCRPRRTKRPQDGPKRGSRGIPRTEKSSPPPQKPPRRSQRGPKRPPRRPKRRPRGPKEAPRGPKTAPKRPQNSASPQRCDNMGRRNERSDSIIHHRKKPETSNRRQTRTQYRILDRDLTEQWCTGRSEQSTQGALLIRLS